MSEPKHVSRPVISVAISARSHFDGPRLHSALSDLAQEDPTIRIKAESADGQIFVVGGMSEMHLETLVERVQNEYQIAVDVGKFEITYLETVRQPAEAEGKYIRQMSRTRQYAHVKIRLEPQEPGSGYQFINQIPEGTIPQQFLETVDAGIQEAMQGGVVAGHEMVDFRAILVDGSYHAEDSNEMAFKIAAAMAFREAARKASPVILEPVMSVEVTSPENFMGAVVGDLSRRRGLIERMESIQCRAGSCLVHVLVPLAEMIGYVTYLRLTTHGAAECSMHFARYQESRRSDDSGGNEAGVTADRPKRPKAGSGFAAAELGAE